MIWHFVKILFFNVTCSVRKILLKKLIIVKEPTFYLNSRMIKLLVFLGFICNRLRKLGAGA